MPSDPRLIVLHPQTSTLRGSTRPNPLPSWPAKDPADFLTHTVDFGPVLAPGAIITIARAVAVNAAVTIDTNITKTATTISVRLGGGTDGTTATVAFEAILSTGEIMVRAIQLPIVLQPGSLLLAAPPSSGFTITDAATGQIITDVATGQPVTFSDVPPGSLLTVTDANGNAIIDPTSLLPLTVTIS